jgi:hypothetical protein
VRQAVSIVHVFVPGQSPEHRLAKLGGQGAAAILAGPGIGETLPGKLRQSKRIIEFAKGEQTRIRRGPRTVELQLQGSKVMRRAALCASPAALSMSGSTLTSHQLSLWNVEQNRVRDALRNKRIWGTRDQGAISPTGLHPLFPRRQL